MSEQPKQPPQTGTAEADGFAEIMLIIQKPDRKIVFHDDTCVIKSAILGKKEELESLLGPPEKQTWFLKSTEQIMEDDKTFAFYGLKADDDTPVEITVQISA